MGHSIPHKVFIERETDRFIIETSSYSCKYLFVRLNVCFTWKYPIRDAFWALNKTKNQWFWSTLYLIIVFWIFGNIFATWNTLKNLTGFPMNIIHAHKQISRMRIEGLVTQREEGKTFEWMKIKANTACRSNDIKI